MAKIRSIRRSVKRSVPFKYCSLDTDRHGNERFYIRVPGMPKYRMKALYSDDEGNITTEFAAEYHSVMAGDRGRKNEPEIARIEPGTVLWLVQNYYRSKAFQSLGASTRKDKKSVLDDIAPTSVSCLTRRSASPISKRAR